MKRVVAILVLAILLSGCVGVDGEPLTIGVDHEYAFTEGCMASIFFLTSPQNLPPIDEAIGACASVYELYMDAQGTGEVEVEVDCTGGTCL